MITPANALKMSIWLAHAHPQAFRTLAQRVRNTQPVRTRTLGRFGALGCGCAPRPLGYSLGYLGQDDSGDGLETVTVDASDVVDQPAYDPGSFSFTLDDPTLTDFSPDFSSIEVAGDLASTSDPTAFDTSFFDTPAATSSAPAPSSSNGFWSALGSAVTGGLSAVGSAVGTVAKAISSPQVLQAAGNIAAASIAANNTAHQAQLQQAVLQTQLARTQTAAGPAPIVYAPNAQAQPQPLVYNPATGQYQPVTASLLPSLTGSQSPWTTVLLIGSAVVLLSLLSGPAYATR